MVPVSELISAHPKLVSKLRRFSFPGAAQLIGYLGLIPELFENTIRIEILAHLAAATCSGGARPQGKDLSQWIGKLLADSPFASQEDPAEDVFVGCVNSEFGSYRIFQGIFGDGAFLVERLLAFFAEKKSFPTFQETVDSVISLLTLSDALAERAGLPRNAAGGGTANGRVVVPRWRDLEPKSNAVNFSTDDLAALGLSTTSLADFLLRDEDRARLHNERMWGSSLERRPLLPVTDGLVVVEPSTLARSAVRLMTERMKLMGRWGETFYQQENATIFVNEVRHSFQIDWLDFDRPRAPENTPILLPAFGAFDVGKPVIMLTYTPSLSSAVDDFAGYDTLTDEEQHALDSYVQACASKLEKMEGFSGGMVLICMATYGKAAILGLKEWSNKWDVHIAPLRDWLSLAADGCTAMMLWKLGRHDAARQRYNIELLNPAGIANLVAFWKRSDFRLIPREMDIHHPQNLAVIGCDFAKAIRVTAIQHQDEHCILSHSGDKWVRVVRHNSRAIFAEDEQAPIYGALADARNDHLLGCTKRCERVWWVVSPRVPERAELRDLLFQFWDCVLSWTDRLAPVVEREWPIPEARSLELCLELPDFDRWQQSASGNSSLAHADIHIDTDAKDKRVTLTVPEGFFRYFNQAKNVAERLLVTAILEGSASLSGADVCRQRVDELVREITRNEDSRYFHIVETHELEQLIGAPNRPRPLFVSDDDTALAELGLADLAGRPPQSEVIGRDQCRKFLQDVVTKVWERVEQRLAPFARGSVVAGCLRAMDEITRDEAHWDLTTRSLLAMHDAQGETRRVIRNRRSKQAAASLANRLLIETSQYACADTSSRPFNQAEHLALLAEMILLITLAQHRDAIAFGFIEPRVGIHPNGEIDVDEGFYREVFSKYLSHKADRRTQRAADNYETYFKSAEADDKEDTDQNDRIAAFDVAFQPEYGFSVHKLLQLNDVWREFAIKSKTSGGWLSETEITELLVRGCEFTSVEANAFLDRFTLPIRSGWDRDLPQNCKPDDVFPWRYRRNLSLLMRPLVQVRRSPQAWFISATMFRTSVSYVLGNLERGVFPERFFASDQMRAYIGRVINKKGHAFAERVYAAFINRGFEARLEIEMTEFRAPERERLGDVDVLAWNRATGRVYAVECKKLLTALTVREVIQRLEDFRGNKKAKDSLGRHLRRADWLATHSAAVGKVTGMPATFISLVPLLVTSEIVPMQFYEEMNFPTNQVIPYDGLSDFLDAGDRSDHPAEK